MDRFRRVSRTSCFLILAVPIIEVTLVLGAFAWATFQGGNIALIGPWVLLLAAQVLLIPMLLLALFSIAIDGLVSRRSPRD